MRVGCVSCLNLRVISSDMPFSLFIIEPNKANRKLSHPPVAICSHWLCVFVLLLYILFFLHLLCPVSCAVSCNLCNASYKAFIFLHVMTTSSADVLICTTILVDIFPLTCVTDNLKLA